MYRLSLTFLCLLTSSLLTFSQDPLTDLYYQGKYLEVITSSEQDLAAGDTARYLFQLKALAEDQLGQINASIRTLLGALEVHPSEQGYHRMLARQYVKAGAFAEARLKYSQLVEKDPDDVISWLELAEIASFRQHNDEAIAALEEVLRIDSINLEGLAKMGEILDRHNNSGALVYYRRAISHYPDNQKVAYALSNWYIKAKQPFKAIPICRFILENDTTNIRFNKLLGYAYYKSGKPLEARTYLQDAIELGDSTAFVFKFLGISHWLNVNYDGAVESLRLSLEKDSLDAEVHFFLGASLATTREKDSAMAHLEKSLFLMMPEASIASRIYAEQANIHRLEGRYEASYELYSRSYETDTSNVISLYLMASLQDNSLDDDHQALIDYEHFIARLDQLPRNSEKPEMKSIRTIVEDRIISLKEEIFFRDEH